MAPNALTLVENINLQNLESHQNLSSKKKNNQRKLQLNPA